LLLKLMVYILKKSDQDQIPVLILLKLLRIRSILRQLCYFLQGSHPYNLETLPVTSNIAKVEYRIAYVAFCIENSDLGRILLEALKGISVIDPESIQFCCADWFWKKQVDSFVLQVEPDRFKHKNRAVLDYKEALKIEKIRNKFFILLDDFLREKKISI